MVSARRTRLEVSDGLRSGDSINLQVVGRLVTHYRSFGERTVPAVDRTGREPGSAQFSLQVAHGPGPGSRGAFAGV